MPQNQSERFESADVTSHKYPERSLWAAVLGRAITDVLGNEQTVRYHGKFYTTKDRRDAIDWMRLNPGQHIRSIEEIRRFKILVSFEWVCFVLDLDPKEIRNRVIWYRDNNAKFSMDRKVPFKVERFRVRK